MPKEHGSWGMFFLPLALGLMGAGRMPADAYLFLAASVLLFLAREPFLEFWRLWRRGQPLTVKARRGLGLLVGAGALGAALLTRHPLLLPFAAVAGAVLVWQAQAAMRGAARSLSGELIAIAASMLNAPAAYYVASGRLDARAAVLFVSALLYFAGTVFYVKMRVKTAHAKVPAAAEGARRACIAYHLLLSAAVIPLGWLPAFGYAAPIARALYYGFRPTRELNLKQIGWTEVVMSLVWLACQTGNSIP